MVPLNAESLEGAKAAFLAATPSASRRAAKIYPKDGPVLIDLTGALEDQPQARLRAPSAEPSLDRLPAHLEPSGHCGVAQ